MSRMLSGPARTIAICARRGGVGKSTITLNLGAELAMRGYAVCMLEIEDSPRLKRMTIGEERRARKLDDRLTTHRLFTTPSEGLGASPFSLNMLALSQEIGVVSGNPLLAEIEDLKDELDRAEREDLLLRRGWERPSRELRFVPGTTSLKRLDSEYALAQASASSREFDPYLQLARAIEVFRSDFDFILMDTPPTLNIIQTNAAMAADKIVLVLDFDPDSILDYDDMIEFTRGVNHTCRQIGVPTTDILGVVYNKFKQSRKTHMARYQRYTQPYVDEQGALQPPQVEYQELATIPYDLDRLDAAMQARRPMCVYAPVSPIGTCLHLMAHTIEKACVPQTPSK